ncbi:hypothetical protein KL86CLO1_11169 [uncultured Eubacteriales bacterium]|uniref:Uncharacterized protein n=1 Tax=uncultured Eubacteriales bacterium TaxID=172733 RepID=A0A212JIK1_9FIRM|nr:hypothetical protein KL86CLO1_11169 [uncultured Eubacteriales bacterium]
MKWKGLIYVFLSLQNVSLEKFGSVLLKK